MNNVNLIGRLTRDPELKYGQSGKAYAKFSLAVPRKFTKNEADFINCVAFSKTAETISKHFKKGNKIAVEGSLQTNQYESNGEKKNSYEVLIQNFYFLESKNENTPSCLDELE